MKMHWFGDRDHVDHSLCGGCEDDADCTYDDIKFRPWAIAILVIAIASIAALFFLSR